MILALLVLRTIGAELPRPAFPPEAPRPYLPFYVGPRRRILEP